MHFKHLAFGFMFRAVATDTREARSKGVTKILVIDDDQQIRQLIIQIMEDAGFEVIEAKDGKEGVRLFHIHQPALVITDILMPEKDGLETIYELRRGGANVPIIAVCAGGRLFLAFAEKFGANVAIAKPFRPKDLVAAVSRLLEHGS
jgi:DNA-binding response OmpR family regulator